MRKKFDAVGFQRKVREELSRKYFENRDSFLKELKVKHYLIKSRKSACPSDNRAQTVNT